MLSNISYKSQFDIVLISFKFSAHYLVIFSLSLLSISDISFCNFLPCFLATNKLTDDLEDYYIKPSLITESLRLELFVEDFTSFFSLFFLTGLSSIYKELCLLHYEPIFCNF